MPEAFPADTTAPDVSAPTGPEGGADLFRKLKGWTTNAIDHLSEWRAQAEDAYRFYSGDQWTDEERRIFEGDGRVAPIFNLTAINVDAVCGLEVNNRQDVKYLPRTPGDVKVNELLSSVAMWIRDQAQSEDEESDAFKDATITGLGMTETRKPDPETISIDRRDPTEGFYDPTAKKANLVDRRYGGRVIMMDTDEALDFFMKRDESGNPLPDEEQLTYAMLNAKWAQLGLKSEKAGEEKLDYPEHQRTGTGIPDSKPKKVCIVEIEWFDWSNGKKIYQQAFLGATGILETNPLDAWAYNWITGKRDQKTNTWYGIVRALRDPQKLINKFLATVTHILATNAKGGLMYERGVFVDQVAAERDWSNPQKNVEVIEGALTAGKIQPRTAPPLPAGAIQLLEFAIGNIRNVSGINVELLGAADRDQPASLEMQRRQSAVTILASLFDAKRRYHKEQGKTLLALMKTLPPETIVRITIDTSDPQQMQAMIPPGTPPDQAQQMMEQAQQQEEQERFVQFSTVAQAFADPTVKFDVIVDEAPSSPNQQQEIVAKLAMLQQGGVQLPPEAQVEVVKSVGLPSTVADAIANAMQQGGDPEKQQMQDTIQRGAAQIQQLQQQLQQLQANKSIDQQKADTDQFKAETDRAKAEADAVAQAGGVALAPIINDLQTKVSQIGAAVIHLQTPQGLQ